jgi:hypothetical protein
MLYYIEKMIGTHHLHNINAILTHSFQIPVDDFLAMEILNAMGNIKCLDKATITNAIPDLIKSSYQRNTISARSHMVPLSQKFYYVPIFHPGRYKAESGF